MTMFTFAFIFDRSKPAFRIVTHFRLIDFSVVMATAAIMFIRQNLIVT